MNENYKPWININELCNKSLVAEKFCFNDLIDRPKKLIIKRKLKVWYYLLKYNFVIVGTIIDGFESKEAALDCLQKIMEDKKIFDINSVKIFSEYI